MPLVSDEEVEQFVQAQLAVEHQPRVTSFCEAWKRVVTLIVERMEGGSSWSAQRGMAKRLVDAWHKVLWFTLYHSASYEFAAGDALDVLKGYYREASSLASLVHVFVAIIYRDDAELAQVRAQIDDIRRFCDQELADIEREAASGVVTVTTEEFEGLESCSMELLKIVLASELAERFVQSYDAAIGTIDQLIDLVKINGTEN